MFNRLIDLIIDFVGLFYFTTVILDYEKAVVLRLGRYKKTLDPGFHFVMPFAIDTVLKDNVVFETTDLPAQSITTKDGKNIVASAVVGWRTRDIRKLLIDVEDAETVLTDAGRGSVRQVLCSKTWHEIQTGGDTLDEELTKAIRTKAFRWGIEVVDVTFSDLCRTMVLRLVQDTDSRRGEIEVME